MSHQPNNALAPFEQLPCAVICLDQRHEVESFNEAARRMLLPFCDRDASPEGAMKALVTRWLAAELTGFATFVIDEHCFEKECVNHTGMRSFEVRFKRVRNAFGASLGVVLVLTDVTTQARMAEALRRAYRDMEVQVQARTNELACANESLRLYAGECKAAAAALKKLSGAIEQTADHVIITDRQGVIEYVNPAFERLTGFTRAEAVGRTPRLVNSGKMEPKFFEGLWAAIIAGEVFRAVFINKKKNGETYYEEKTITPIHDEQGLITHFISTGRDVTERKHAEAEREKLIGELRASMAQVKLLSGLLPVCSHCKKIKDAEGRWDEMEMYVRKHSEAKFSHGVCPDCAKKFYPEYADDAEGKAE